MKRQFLVGVILLASLCPSALRADDKADNPKYTSWAKFKPGSSSTVAADMEVNGSKYHISLTRTLVSIDADNAVVESKSTMNLLGHDQTMPARQETIPSKIAKDELKETGTKDVQAIGKTFKCRVYETNGGSGAAGAAHSPANPESMKASVYMSDDVPGGLVRLEAVGRNGAPLTFILTAMESK
jgi:hypothetical protein